MRSATISLGPHRLGFISFVSLAIPLALASCSRYDGELSEGEDSYESALGDSEGDDSDSGEGDSDSVGSTSADAGDDDSGSPCVDPCPAEGALTCEGDAVAVCADNGDGCLAWGEPEACGDGEVCEEGACLIEASDHFDPPAQWSVPDGGNAAGGFHSALGVPGAVGDDHWSLLDINGDHRLDLVVTARAVNKQGYAWFSRTMGYPNAPYWEVYVGEADGFADTPIAWPVPSEGRQDHGLIHHEGTPKIAGDAYWSLRDIDGDERPDLVITGRAQDGDGDWFGRAIGYPNTPYWEVYLNEGDGFAKTPTNWMLPHGGPAERGYYVADGEPEALGDPKWEVRDLDDDGYPDLVVTGKALSVVDNGFLVRALGSLESPYWEIYRGSAKGFGDTPEAWLVPVGGYKTGGFARGESPPEKIGDDCWRLRDLDGNGLDDLIVTARASAINGSDWEGKVPGFPSNSHWVVYENTGDGFRRTASQWPVPEGGFGGQGFVDFDGQALSPGDQSWETFDLDGDGQLELVVTSAWEEGQTPICRGQVLGFADGEPRWDVFETTSRGFAADAWRFGVPAAGLQLCGLRATAGQPIKDGDTTWFTTKLDPDHYPDLLMTGVGFGDPPVQEVLGFDKEPHWLVYRGSP